MVYRENVLLYNINKDLRKTKVINIENNVQNLVRVGYLRLQNCPTINERERQEWNRKSNNKNVKQSKFSYLVN